MSRCIFTLLWLLGLLPLCSVVHSSESPLDVVFWWTHFQAPQNLPFPPLLLFPIAFCIVPLRDLLLQLVCLESVPLNPEIPHSDGDGDKGGLTFLNGWSFQFVLPKALPKLFFCLWAMLPKISLPVLGMVPCLKGNSPQCKSSRPGLVVNWSKLIIHQVAQQEFKFW